MIISSRSAAEYHAMFGLTPADLARWTVLDCSAGGSSFTAETAGRVVAADPAYALDRHDLAALVRASLHEGGQMIAEHAAHQMLVITAR